ncbi:MAG: hypothetical protein KDD56_01280 [Bdellovibrionales bacterium]|nr:hypothetical protein [Bdellovibrionales bacterium]
MLKQLIGYVDSHYTKQTRKEFLEKFDKAGFTKFYTTPIMDLNKVNPRMRKTAFDAIEYTKINKLSCTNPTDKKITLQCYVRFTDADNLKGLFENFISVSHHLLRFQHFHHFPKYYSGVYSGPRYFFFHGDGFCTFLSVMFQGLCMKLLNIKPITMYCRSDDFMMSHGYCRYDDGITDWYIDPDLMEMFPYKDFENIHPSSWFINFLENIAVHLYNKLSKEEQNSLFYDFTRDHISWVDSCDIRELSQRGSSYSVSKNLLIKTLLGQHEVYDVWANDYPWKEEYRKYARQFSSEDFFFCQNIDKPLEITLPPQSTFSVNETDQEVELHLRKLQEIFYGRAPGRIKFCVNKLKDNIVVLPEIPWMLTVNGDVNKIIINGISFDLRPTGSDLKYLGMGDLDPIKNDLLELKPLKINLESDAVVSIYIPLNASFWNSKFISICCEDSKSLEVKSC